MSEHTPGPWKVNDSLARDGGDFGISILARYDATGYARVADLPDGEVDAETYANARLIASAPTLLAAAQAALLLLEELAERAAGPLAMPYPETEQLRTAIARATGE